MKTQMLHRIWLFVGLIVSLSLAACAPAVKKVEKVDPNIVSKPGFYSDKAVGFSLAWPAEVFTVKGDLEGGERVRITHSATLPVLTIAVDPKAADAPSLEALGGVFKDDLEQMQMGSSRFKLRESKVVQLSDGTDAAYSMVTWKYGGTYALVTVAVMVYKGDNLVTVSCTAPPGQPPVEVLSKWVMALKVF